MTNGPTRRVWIERLDLDLRGISPETAEQAVRALGPALSQALRGHRVGADSSSELDAGTITIQAGGDAAGLTRVLAQRLASALGSSSNLHAEEVS